jgi:hypothetical protein
MATGESKATGFIITDRRAFTDGGEARQEKEREKERESEVEVQGRPSRKPLADDPSPAGLPVVDFHTFVLSLGSSALLHLGELEDPDAGPPQKDLPLAKHTIDILAMLEEKTKGNLTAAEAKLIESLLYDLRLRFVEAKRSAEIEDQLK